MCLMRQKQIPQHLKKCIQSEFVQCEFKKYDKKIKRVVKLKEVTNK